VPSLRRNIDIIYSLNFREGHPAANPPSPNKSLQRSGGQWYLVCTSLAVIDKLPMTSLGEPPATELSRYGPRNGGAPC
jgi:hypothetical protein